MQTADAGKKENQRNHSLPSWVLQLFVMYTVHFCG